MNLILNENYKNLIVVDFDNNISFIHDNNSGKNYFNREAIANCLGTNIESVHKGIQRYMTKWTICPVSLQLVGSDKPVEFYPFRVLSYLAHRSRSDKATEIVNYIEDAIDEKFNRDTGFKQTRITGRQLLTLEEKLQRENNALVKQIMHKQLEISNLEIENAKLKKLYYQEKLAALQEDSECLK